VVLAIDSSPADASLIRVNAVRFLASSHPSASLAFCSDGIDSARIMTLAYGGTGSTDANAPSMGPIVMKAVSLPSTS
jgi:hypothetical protein